MPGIEDWLHPLADTYRSLPTCVRRVVGSVYRSLPTDWRYGREYGRTLAMLKETEGWSCAQLRDYQASRLAQLVSHAYQNVLYYKHVFDEFGLRPVDIVNLSALGKLPFLTKNLVRHHKAELLARNIPPANRLYMNTGGSTGTPLELHYEKSVSRAREWAFMHTLWRRVGWQEGSSRVMLRGWSVPDGLWQYEPIRNRLIMSAYHLTEANLAAYLRKIRDFAPDFIEAYPSNLTILARHIERENVRPIRSVKAVLAGSENLFPAQRALLATAFDCRVYSWYGHGEIAALGGGCEVNDEFHMFPEYGIVELI